jgi:membrane protein DedA with SNARE-associated domain
VLAIFIQKFIYGVKTLVPISMALAKYDFKKFIFFNIFASVIFVLTIGLSAYFASESIIAFFSVIQERPWLAPLAMVTILGSVWLLLNKMTKK